MKLMRFIWGVLAICGLLLAAVAWGSDVVPPPGAADNTSAMALVAFLQGTVFPLVTALLMGFLVPFLRKMGEKFGVDAITQRNNILERLALQGITLAEERAAQLIGSRAALSGNQKLDIAVGHVLNFMPKISAEQATALVESMLAQIPGAGATKTAAYTPASSLPTADIIPITAAG